MSWGGARPNSGRPQVCEELRSRSVGFSLYPDEIEMIEEFAEEHQISRSRALRTLLGLLFLDGRPDQSPARVKEAARRRSKRGRA